jgi:hypothetical protein
VSSLEEFYQIKGVTPQNYHSLLKKDLLKRVEATGKLKTFRDYELAIRAADDIDSRMASNLGSLTREQRLLKKNPNEASPQLKEKERALDAVLSAYHARGREQLLSPEERTKALLEDYAHYQPVLQKKHDKIIAAMTPAEREYLYNTDITYRQPVDTIKMSPNEVKKITRQEAIDEAIKNLSKKDQEHAIRNYSELTLDDKIKEIDALRAEIASERSKFLKPQGVPSGQRKAFVERGVKIKRR